MSITPMTRDTSPDVGGLGLALFSAATFGTSGTFADSLMHAGWSPAAVVTARITLAAVLLTAPAVRALHGKWTSARLGLPSIAAFGLVAVAGCQLCFFNAVARLNVGVALLLEYSGILLVVVWMWLHHRQRPRRLTLVAGAAALLGLLLVLDPSGGNIDPVGLMWGLLAACGLAFYFVVSSGSDDGVSPIALAWGAMVAGSVTLITLDLLHIVAFHATSGNVVLLHRSMSWIVPVVGLALVAAAIAYATGIAAARRLGAKLASFVGLTEVLFAVLIAWVLLGQAPGIVQAVGGLVVLVGIALVRADELAAADGTAGAGRPGAARSGPQPGTVVGPEASDDHDVRGRRSTQSTVGGDQGHTAREGQLDVQRVGET